ncbi:PAS domain-containing protein [Candidatus Saccharibacteria bacterium]|nr:PAS domain-containing protein [Candidatus Saccharibacteria bacterium]
MTDIPRDEEAERNELAARSAGVLAQSEALFNSMGDGAIATDEFGRIVRVNPVALRLLGYEESEFIGEWFPKVVVALDETKSPISLLDRPITKAFLTGKTISDQLLYRTREGEHRPVAATVSPILLDGRPIGAIEVFRDITLEREVDRMKSEFISLASHQLRTPLSAIKTYSHMLIDGFMGELSASQQKALDTILSASDRMNELINLLLNVSRIEGGNITLNIKRHDLNKLMSELEKELALQAREKNIQLVFIQPKTLVHVRTDNLIAKEVLTNLITNAIKYTPDGGKVTIRLRARADSAVFSVADSGIGIPKYSQDHIFSKFFRAQNVMRTETTGSGLGLYLVKGLVDNLDGKIWFKSEENVGSTFYLELPKKPTIVS